MTPCCILQLTEALSFLHMTAHLIHRNVCPASVLITRRGTWKLAGLEFAGNAIYSRVHTLYAAARFSRGIRSFFQRTLYSRGVDSFRIPAA